MGMVGVSMVASEVRLNCRTVKQWGNQGIEGLTIVEEFAGGRTESMEEGLHQRISMQGCQLGPPEVTLSSFEGNTCQH